MTVFDIYGKPLIKNSLRICALNVGNFSNGGGNPAGTDTMYNNFIDTFRKCNANIYMFSEWDNYWNSDRTITSKSVFSFLKPYQSTYITDGIDRYQGQMIYSDFPITSEYHQAFNTESVYYFLVNTVVINGEIVYLISTHYTWKTQEKRQSQIQEILDYIKNKNIKNYIIAGDMNLGLHKEDDRPDTNEVKFEIARGDVDLLESDGAISAQGGPWGLHDRDGFLNTAGHGGWAAANTNMFDNIVISPTLRFDNVFVATTAETDHDAICADIDFV